MNKLSFLINKQTNKKRECVTFIFDPLVKSLNSKREILHYRLHCLRLISCPSVHTSLFMSHLISFHKFPSVHTSLITLHFYFLQSTIHLIHFIYHSPFHSHVPYLVALILHCHSTLLLVSLFSQSPLWQVTTCKCLYIKF